MGDTMNAYKLFCAGLILASPAAFGMEDGAEAGPEGAPVNQQEEVLDSDSMRSGAGEWARWAGQTTLNGLRWAVGAAYPHLPHRSTVMKATQAVAGGAAYATGRGARLTSNGVSALVNCADTNLPEDSRIKQALGTTTTIVSGTAAAAQAMAENARKGWRVAGSPQHSDHAANQTDAPGRTGSSRTGHTAPQNGATATPAAPFAPTVSTSQEKSSILVPLVAITGLGTLATFIIYKVMQYKKAKETERMQRMIPSCLRG